MGARLALREALNDATPLDITTPLDLTTARSFHASCLKNELYRASGSPGEARVLRDVDVATDTCAWQDSSYLQVRTTLFCFLGCHKRKPSRRAGGARLCSLQLVRCVWKGVSLSLQAACHARVVAGTCACPGRGKARAHPTIHARRLSFYQQPWHASYVAGVRMLQVFAAGQALC